MSLKTILAGAVLSVMASAPLQAATFYEIDYGGDFVWPDIGPLAFGVTEIVGRISGEMDRTPETIWHCMSGDCHDTVVFSIAAGQQLEVAEISMNMLGPTGSRYYATFSENYSVFAGRVFEAAEDGVFYGSPRGPLGPGTYHLRVGAENARAPGPFSGDYRVSLTTTTAAVPLPASLPLLAGALGVLGLVRRWRGVV